jgi:four helix bundle protein
MATFTCFEEIKAWQKARVLCSKIYLLATTTELAKDFKLRDQINRSSGSVMDNIAEGFGRGGNKEFVQFLEVSHGSACECQSQLCRLLDRNYISKKEFDELYRLCGQIRGMVIKLINYLQTSNFKGIKFLNRDMP